MSTGPVAGFARHRSALAVALLAGLLAVSGCGGLAGPAGLDPTPTATPAPVPTVSPSESGATRAEATDPGVDRRIAAPGLTVVPDGVRTNATRLGRAHDLALDRAGSYRRTVTLTVRREDGTVVARDRESVLADRDAGRYLIVGTPRLAPGPFDEPVEYERFVANGTRHAYRRFANGSTRVDRTPAASPPRGRWRVDGRALAGLLARADLRGGSYGDAGAPGRYVVAGRYPDPPTARLLTDADGGRLRATVRADGLIAGLRLSYRARSGRQPVAVVLSVEHDRLGRTAVDQPSWLGGQDDRTDDRDRDHDPVAPNTTATPAPRIDGGASR